MGDRRSRWFGRWTLLAATAVAVVASTSSWAEQNPDQLVARGRAVFEKTAGGIGCAACHGHFGMGDIATAPNIRAADETRVKNALGGVGAMRFLAPTLSPEDVRAVQAFLRYLNTLKPKKVAIDETGFTPATITVGPKEPVQLIVKNDGDDVCRLVSPEAKIEATTIEPGAVGDVVWTSPAKPGTFKVRCTERADASLTITVTDAGSADASK